MSLQADDQPGGEGYDEQVARINDVIDRYADTLLALPHVVGLGVGLAHVDGESTGELALVVMVDSKKPVAALSPDEIIPPEIEGVRVDVQEMGQLTAQ